MAFFPAGTLLVLNDNGSPGQPGGVQFAAAIDPAGSYLSSTLLPCSEQGEILPNGVMLIPGEASGSANYIDNFYVYDADLNLIATIAAQFHQSSVSPVRGDYAHKFYVPQLDRTLITIDDTGAVGGTTWTLPANSDGIRGGTPARDGSIYYYIAVSGAIHRYDLVNDVPLSDLASYLGLGAGDDLIINGDGDLLIVLLNLATGWIIRRYQPDGTLAQTYSGYTDMGLGQATSPPRISLALDDPDSFWLMVPGADQIFINIRTSDGAVLTEFAITQDQSGETGPAPSCPLLVTFGGSITPVTGAITMIEPITPGQPGGAPVGGTVTITNPPPTEGLPGCVLAFPAGDVPEI